MRVISKKVNDEPKTTKCLNCGAELEYLPEDVHIGLWGTECVTCPECEEENPVADKRAVAPILNKTFLDFGAKHGAAHIDDEDVQMMIDKVYQILTKGEAGDYYVTGTGDVLVFGIRTEDEITVYVTRDWKEDITCLLC